jgi:hypothetical protein
VSGEYVCGLLYFLADYRVLVKKIYRHKITFFFSLCLISCLHLRSVTILVGGWHAILKENAVSAGGSVRAVFLRCFLWVFCVSREYPVEYTAYFVVQFHAGIPAYRLVEADKALFEHAEYPV